MNPPGVEDCPSQSGHESYQEVVVSAVVGSVVVVVGGNVVIALSFINFRSRRRRNLCFLRCRAVSVLPSSPSCEATRLRGVETAELCIRPLP